MRDRVCFIRMRYNGYSVEEAASNIGFTTKTGYNIQESWNEHGMDGLKPNFKGGPKSRLTDEQKEEIKEALGLNPMLTRMSGCIYRVNMVSNTATNRSM